MTSRFFSNRAIAWYLPLVSLCLCSIGILFVHSTMRVDGETFPGTVAWKQIAKAGIAFSGFLILTRINYRIYEKKSYSLYGLVVFLLCVLLSIKLLRGEGSAARWFRFALFDIQPSELMKIGLVVCLARFLRYRRDQGGLRGLVFPCLLTVIPMGLVILQPDLGTALVLPCILFAMVYIAGAPWKYLVAVLALAAISIPAIGAFGDRLPILKPYQLSRITGWLNQDNPAVKLKEAYQLDQSKVAIGSGGFAGRGYGQGSQNVLGNLPARHTDFIFSVVAEEWGFLGALCLLLLLVGLVLLCFTVALNTEDPYGKLLAVGVGALFAVQTFQNIGMTVGLTPITGLPLPFVSYGGSSLVSSFAALALVVRVARQRIRVLSPGEFEPVSAAESLPAEKSHTPGKVPSLSGDPALY